MDLTHKDDTIKVLVRTAVAMYAQAFEDPHVAELDNPNGILNMKIHNVFIAALGPEIQYFSALVRSLDSSLGNMLESPAIELARLSFDVQREVTGPLYVEQTHFIAELLEAYKRRDRRPQVADYQPLRTRPTIPTTIIRRHDSDYYLTNRETGDRYIIELKIGGDLDNKKARAEKEAILEQYAILANTLPQATNIQIYFATAYNRFGEDKPWTQERVRQYFADAKLLIGRYFWNFMCQSDHGYELVLQAYRENAHLIQQCLASIRRVYLGQ